MDHHVAPLLVMTIFSSLPKPCHCEKAGSAADEAIQLKTPARSARPYSSWIATARFAHRAMTKRRSRPQVISTALA
jgi:predicted Zn-ribbon and HTH transcriptional regulator